MSSLLGHQNLETLSKLYLPLLAAIALISSCAKYELDQPFEPPVPVIPCEKQTVNPAGRSYSSDSIIAYTCTSKYCGFMPMSSKNYWVYEDSIFDNGVFTKIQLDTLRFNTTVKTTTDGLTWWKANTDVGLPSALYSTDSAVFALTQRAFSPQFTDAKKDYGMFEGDSIRYFSSFVDVAAQCRSLKSTTSMTTPAGTFADYIYTEKNARYYQRDQVYFAPGVGVIKFIREKAQPGTYQVKLREIATLVSYHIE